MKDPHQERKYRKMKGKFSKLTIIALMAIFIINSDIQFKMEKRPVNLLEWFLSEDSQDFPETPFLDGLFKVNLSTNEVTIFIDVCDDTGKVVKQSRKFENLGEFQKYLDGTYENYLESKVLHLPEVPLSKGKDPNSETANGSLFYDPFKDQR